MKKALEKEGKAILGNVRKGAAIVAMCIEGKQISSEELAQFLADRAGSGAGDVAFVIGSSHGLADEVKRAAALKFSMGRITMPHQLARLVLTEQIYRACTINAGMKYHKNKVEEGRIRGPLPLYKKEKTWYSKNTRQWGKLPETTHTTRQASRGRKGCYYNGTERKDP